MVKRCSGCGEKDDFDWNNPFIETPIDLKVKDKELFLCVMCTDDLYELYMGFFKQYRAYHYTLVNRAKEKDHDLPFYRWASASVRSGYFYLKARYSARVIQRNYFNFRLRKTLYLCEKRLARQENLPYLPPEMWMLIVKNL